MNEVLPASVYKFLQKIVVDLRTKPSVVRKPTTTLIKLLDWCDAHDVPLSYVRRGDAHLFNAQQINAIDLTLQELGQTRIGNYQSGASSIQQAQSGYNEDKNIREKPRASRVLVNLPAIAVPTWLTTQPRAIQDIDWRDIHLNACDVLIQVENLDSFYEFSPDISALSGYDNPLVVYLGDSYYGGGSSLLAEAWYKNHRPHIYAGDFDPKGISQAMDSRATHMLLPAIEWLSQNATPLHVPSKQFTSQRRLREHLAVLHPAHPLRDYLTLMLEKQRGLKQQWFGGRLVCISLS
ncbi:DUF7281 domain-containing protein [Vreelandella venusta]|uniref:DUF7281 domain-containing protein n=1 Tax=Vreelandella venusta TaxID=44935 RepID=UPI0018DADEBC|nr:hypothetical protein [Halomonas venusta]QPI64800.1 hypothetical protein IR195_03515 [Halomonas venusta]